MISSLLTDLWIHFPVWRELKLFLEKMERGEVQLESSEYTFPFEGNWNEVFQRVRQGRVVVLVLWIHFPVWRELKLDENEEVWQEGQYWLWIHFPVWRELKRWPCYYHRANWGSLNTLSRLKGIETQDQSPTRHHLRGRVQIRFPVWRELKHNTKPNNIRHFNLFRYAFPFEGNWN